MCSVIKRFSVIKQKHWSALSHRMRALKWICHRMDSTYKFTCFLSLNKSFLCFSGIEQEHWSDSVIKQIHTYSLHAFLSSNKSIEVQISCWMDSYLWSMAPYLWFTCFLSLNDESVEVQIGHWTDSYLPPMASAFAESPTWHYETKIRWYAMTYDAMQQSMMLRNKDTMLRNKNASQ